MRQQISKGISNSRIRQLIYQYKNPQILLNQQEDKLQKKQQLKNNIINLQLLQQRKWLTKKGRKYLIDFDDNQRKQMKFCFNSMDVKGNGSIGIDQLEELLISVGLMESREQVKQLIDSVDQDKSGKIQFSEFLKMILNDQGQNQQIVSFFKYIINSKKHQSKDKDKQVDKIGKQIKNQSIKINPNVNNKKKISLMTDKQNIIRLITEKTNIKQSKTSNNRNKKIKQLQKSNNNSALKIFQKHPHPQNLPFGMVVSHIRRKHMMTALRINNESQSLLKNENNNRSQYTIFNNTIRSNQKIYNKNCCYDNQDVTKGQNVMNALKKMWDRRLLRQIRESKKLQKLQQMRKQNSYLV